MRDVIKERRDGDGPTARGGSADRAVRGGGAKPEPGIDILKKEG